MLNLATSAFIEQTINSYNTCALVVLIRCGYVFANSGAFDTLRRALAFHIGIADVSA
jgi:hypothetical protein